MRIISFPGGDAAGTEDAWIVELDAALNGQAEGPAADSWRELREDVRSLAPPMAAGFERRLGARLEQPQAQPRRSRLFERLGAVARPRVAVGMASATLAGLVVLVLVLSAPQGHGVPPRAVAAGAGAGQAGVKAPSNAPASSAAVPAPSRETMGAGAANAKAGDLVPAGVAAPAGPAAPGRVQQLAASISLSTSPGEVQSVADGVERLAVREEGYVQDSHVQVQRHGSSEANLTLKLPSAHLSAALATIARLAPVSAESQSLQDITNTYDAARQRLDDASAERSALLRALAAATTQGQIDSLRERLSQARGAIAQDQSALEAVSQRASNAEVEVTVLADGGATTSGSEGLTLHRGLHDAVRVLTVALIVILIAAAVLVPLALLICALAGAHRVWRRYRREHALDAR
jgi:Domain of unknown function (DUF4349)